MFQKINKMCQKVCVCQTLNITKSTQYCLMYVKLKRASPAYRAYACTTGSWYLEPRLTGLIVIQKIMDNELNITNT